MPLTPSHRHCSNKYKLAREVEKGKEKDVEKYRYRKSFFMMKSSSVEVFSCCLKIDRDPAFRMGVGRSFHQPGMVNEIVLENNFEPLCDGTTRRRSLAILDFWKGCRFVIVSGRRWVLTLWLFYMQASVS